MRFLEILIGIITFPGMLIWGLFVGMSEVYTLYDIAFQNFWRDRHL